MQGQFNIPRQSLGNLDFSRSQQPSIQEISTFWHTLPVPWSAARPFVCYSWKRGVTARLGSGNAFQNFWGRNRPGENYAQGDVDRKGHHKYTSQDNENGVSDISNEFPHFAFLRFAFFFGLVSDGGALSNLESTASNWAFGTLGISVTRIL
jgi:hypothetical protein